MRCPSPRRALEEEECPSAEATDLQIGSSGDGDTPTAYSQGQQGQSTSVPSFVGIFRYQYGTVRPTTPGGTSTSLPSFTKSEETSASVVPLLRFVSLCCPVCLLLRLRPEGRARESAVQLAHRVFDLPCHRAAVQEWPTSSVFPDRVRLPGQPFLFSHPPPADCFLPHPAICYTGPGDLTALRGTWSLINNFTANHAGVGVAHDWSVAAHEE